VDADQGRSTELNRAAVYVEQHGSGTPVVLIHGGLTSSAMWEAVGWRSGRTVAGVSKRPPLPVKVGAIAFVVVSAPSQVATALAGGGADLVFGLAMTFAVVILAYQLWLGTPVVLWVVCLILGANAAAILKHLLITGGWRYASTVIVLLIAGLLLIPRSARRWFGLQSQGGTSGPGT
jgi:hypothetical protein